MELSDFRENDKDIRDRLSKSNFVMELVDQSYAARIGIILSQFAAIETFTPRVLSMMTGLSAQDARSIMSVFRAFSNRIDLIKEICKPRDPNSVDAIVGRYLAGQFTDANKIRNKYAHAQYKMSHDSLTITPFGSEFNRKRETVPLTHEDLKDDLQRMSQIHGELTAIVDWKQIPSSLHKQLHKPVR